MKLRRRIRTPEDVPSGREGAKGPLVALLAADAISLTGGAMTYVAVPWFVLEQTGSAALTGLAAALTFLPTVLSTFFGGGIVDRIGFRRVSVASDLASGATVAAIPALHLTAGIEIWQLLALVFLGALFDAPGTTARRSLLPDIAVLAGTRIERATGVAGAIERGSLLVGAPVAGLLVAVIGATNVLWLDAATFGVSALLVGLVVPSTPAAADAPPPGRYVADLLSGVRFVAGDRLVRAVVLTALVTNFLDAPIPVVFPVLAREAFGSAVDLGLMFGVFGGFALLGSLLFGAFGHRLPRHRTFVVAYSLASLPYLALSTLPSFPATLALMALWGLAVGPINPVLRTVAYERVPAHLRGRVLGAATAGAYVAIPLGALAGGLVVEAIGVSATLLAIGLCYVAVTSAGLANRAFREMDSPAASTARGS